MAAEAAPEQTAETANTAETGDDGLTEDPDRLVKKLQRDLGDRLSAVYRYGAPLHADESGDGARRLLVVVDEVDLEVLRKAGPASVRLRKLGLRVRLDTAVDILKSSDAYPVFTLALLDTMKLVAGDDVLESLTVRPEDLRLRIEQALRTLFHELTDEYLFAPKNELRIDRLMHRCGRRLVYLLEGLLILKGHLDSPTGSTSPSHGPEGILKASVALLEERERDTLKRMWNFVIGEEASAGDALYDLYGDTLALLKVLIRHADTHGRAKQTT